MRIFAIKDESLPRDIILGYLIYYELSKSFYIELPEDADPWETPLLLSSFVRQGRHSVSSYWSRLWVQQRIIPQDRQNIGQVLKENGLKEYDEFQLLMLTGTHTSILAWRIPWTMEPGGLQSMGSQRVRYD